MKINAEYSIDTEKEIFIIMLASTLRVKTEKLITSSGRRSLKSTQSKLIIFADTNKL